MKDTIWLFRISFLSLKNCNKFPFMPTCFYWIKQNTWFWFIPSFTSDDFIWQFYLLHSEILCSFWRITRKLLHEFLFQIIVCWLMLFLPWLYMPGADWVENAGHGVFVKVINRDCIEPTQKSWRDWITTSPWWDKHKLHIKLNVKHSLR